MSNERYFTRRRVLAGIAAGGSLLAAPSVLRAQAFPNKNIRIIVPFPAGGTTDMLARLFAQRFTETMGQTVLVENVGGGGGSIGAEQVARAPADGHTLLFHNLTFSTTTSSLQYAGRSKHDIEKDFIPIAVGAYVPILMMAHPSVKAKDLKEFAAFAKETKEPLFYGSTGPGSVMNLVGEVFKRDAGIKMDHVPFRGAAPLVQELLSGRIQLGGDQISTSLQHVAAGSLTPIAVCGDKRSPALPNTPTVREAGFPNIELQGWNGFFAPAGTPPEVVAKLNKEIDDAVKRPDIAKKMTDVGAEPAGGTQTAMRDMLRMQIAKVKPVVEELKLLVQ